jgi:hypothetical protein
MNGQAVKKPIKIDFYEWDGNKARLLSWADQIGGKKEQSLFEFEDPHGDQKTLCCLIKTLEGDHLCRPGDIIIQGVNGEYYPCEREIFDKAYDIVEAADHRVFGAAIIVSAFPGCGKSYCAQHGRSLIAHDSDSSNFHFEEGARESNPDWPQNYIQHIKQLKSRGYYDVIFISSHAEIRQALKEAGLRYLLVYPEKTVRKSTFGGIGIAARLRPSWSVWRQTGRPGFSPAWMTTFFLGS